MSILDSGRLCCVAIVGRPVARKLMNGYTAEITRVASDHTPHAASMCIAAATRMAIAGGYRRIVSYTILGESGVSYRAAGWHVTAINRGGNWSSISRYQAPAIQPGAKVRWETGPDAIPEDSECDRIVRESIGKIDIPARLETLPLFSMMEA